MLLSAKCVLREKKASMVNSILYRAYSIVEETEKAVKRLGPGASRGMGRVIWSGGQGGPPRGGNIELSLDECGGACHPVGCG